MAHPVGALAAAVDAAAQLPVDRLAIDRLHELVAGLSGQLDRLAGVRDGALAELHARAAGQVPAHDRPADEHSPRCVATATWLGSVGPAEVHADGDGRADTAAGCGGAAAGRLVREAALLARLPLLAQAVRTGRVGRPHAMVLLRLLDKLDADALLASQESLLLLASRTDPVMLAHWVRHQVATYCEPEVEQQAERAARRRYLQLRDNHDGTSCGRFLVPTELTEAMCTVLEALSRRAGEHDDRTAGQRRADGLLEVFEQVATHGDGSAPGARPQVSYVVPAGWASGDEPPPWPQALDAELGGTGQGPVAGAAAKDGCTSDGGAEDSSGTGECSGTDEAVRALATHPESASEPGVTYRREGSGSEVAGEHETPSRHGSLEGHDSPRRIGGWTPDRASPSGSRRWCGRGAWSGPQTRAHLEALLCDARLSRVLLDPCGQVQSLSTLTDTATPSQRRALAARDGGCTAHGCTRPPTYCDVHHLWSLSDGGPTVLDNLVLLCRRHHRLWHRGRLQLEELCVPWYRPPPLNVIEDG